jgi:hypothetical protein
VDQESGRRRSTRPSAPFPTCTCSCSANDGSFYERVPEDVRKQGPWQGTRHGDVEALKPEYRLALARDRYVLVKCEEAVFNPET